MLNFLFGFLSGFGLFVSLSFGIVRLGLMYFRRHPENVGPKLMRPLMKAGNKKLKKAS